MRLPTREADTPDINLTPLIDVVFLMLVFFVVSTTFTEDRALEVTLPAADSTAEIERPRVVASMTADGRIRINGVAVPETQEGLGRALEDALAGQPGGDAVLLIRADRRVPHGEVTRVMSEAGRLGFSTVSIATTREPNIQ
ncbi:ExbD/TolR family protein [Spiribacter onubensis]|uniref:Biopolymer transporter ExbD n=1 Tax=Spiribacter onubensis TaxID=3122420 RepID=A0ABV3S7W2_9GAMM